jgi:hypothetical protein
MNESFSTQPESEPTTLGNVTGWNWLAAQQEEAWRARMEDLNEQLRGAKQEAKELERKLDRAKDALFSYRLRFILANVMLLAVSAKLLGWF